jgi:branched-chain amino acid transport system permease protein
VHIRLALRTLAALRESDPFNLNQGIEYLFMAVVGGAGSVWGAVVGATLITLAKQVLQDWLPIVLGRSGNFEMVVFGVLMVIVLQRAREGVWPWIARWLPQPQAVAVPDAQPLPARDRAPPPGRCSKSGKRASNSAELVAVNDLSFAIQPGGSSASSVPTAPAKARCST